MESGSRVVGGGMVRCGGGMLRCGGGMYGAGAVCYPPRPFTRPLTPSSLTPSLPRSPVHPTTQFVEPYVMSCPVPQLTTLVTPLLAPLLTHMLQRISFIWSPQAALQAKQQVGNRTFTRQTRDSTKLFKSYV